MATIPLPQWINEHDLACSFEHIKVNRKGFSDHSDIWHIRFHWDTIKVPLLTDLNQGHYCLSPMQLIEKKNGERLALWSAQDAIVLHALSQYLAPILPLHARCEHVQGHGGGKRSIVKLHQYIQTHRAGFVLRTDIRGYYANIDKSTLLNQLKGVVSHPVILDLLTQFIHYSVERGGLFHTPKKGIARSASLSPLLAAFHLYEIDTYFSQQPHCYYARYMDDFIILVSRRWHLRHAIKSLNHFFTQFGFKQHPDKTFIGRCQKGFDWMGFWFTEKGCTDIAPRAQHNHRIKLTRLYERTERQPADMQAVCVSRYLLRWARWKNDILNTVTSLLSKSAALQSKYPE